MITTTHATEVHRLAVAGRQIPIAQDVGRGLGWVLLGWSRFAQVEAIATATLTLGPDANAFYQRGWAYSSTGRPQLALADYEQALALHRQTKDRVGEAAALSNIGEVYDGLGDRRQALAFYERALTISGRSGTGPVRQPL
ncbi:tetratricopeptide repeat protein [Catenuloplanes atrovinosus]|uniref:Tetratricopeptide (TPR) repeat protein n=1 Tax=Catenuloplanes atrovinosus TaxID=137266 RepID=A0AAE3YSD2_9ACTN|nr:tetratricopeptide repeat protein [Catenuloplanes atrovinosus]MDR7277756.1 tetratricopeptide (TPR) repeat protein [Catenuloplanes atrovinosus]